MPTAAVSGSAPQDPLRGEIYSLQHLVEHARRLGAEHAAASRAAPAAPLLQEFRHARHDLEAAYDQIELAVRARADPVPAEEWLLDNMHVVRDQLREISEDLPPGYLVKLPRLRVSPWTGYPRVYVLTLDFITHTDSRLDAENLLHYVVSYQEHAPLTIGELWAIPIMLRLCLVDNLRRLARQEVTARAERALADQWADRLITRARDRSSQSAMVLGELATSVQPLTDEFLTQLLKRVRDEDLPLGHALAWLDDRLTEVGRSAEELTRAERHRQATNQVSVGNCITSMRLIAALDWSSFFERTSVVERILREDPAGAYADMDASSRDVYRHEIERLAARSGVSEPHVATRVVARAAAAGGATERRRHVGYFLVDAGRQPLEADIGYRVSMLDRLRRVALSHPLAVYLGLVSLLVLLLVAVPLTLASLGAEAGWGGLPLLLLVLVLAGLPATEVAITFANVAITTAVRPRVLPKLSFEAGIPATCRTVVAVPALLNTPAAVARLVEDLEIRFLGNQDPHISFALLADFPDADHKDLPEDVALLAQAAQGIEELNRRYASDAGEHFHLLHRGRRWNERQQAWMGWERKRGKLEEFNHLLRGARGTSFVHDVGDPSALRDVRYVITLDADTQLPRDTARRLVGTIEHPLNRPVFDAQQQRVVEGYGVVQPRVSATLTSAGRSFFARVFTGNTGLDPYTTAASDLYQDLFGEGSYYGKGIYDVDAFLASLAERVPENRLLSHDLFEGLFARVALASDIELLDDYPSGYSVYAARQHRWVRGDWQLAPWLLALVPWADGSRPSDLPLLGRWKLLDNLRRSLLAPAILALLVAGLTVLSGPTWAWMALSLSAIVLPVFAHLATPLMRADDGAWTSYVRGHWSSFRSDLLQVAITLALLPEQALQDLDAITRTLVRLLVTRRNLLEWETAAEAERRATTSLGAMWRSMLAGPALAVTIVGLVTLVRPSALPLALPLGLVWLASPFIAYWISQPLSDRRRRPLPADDQRLLRRTARKTWRFFEMFVTADDNWLPPDNYQEDPKGVLARRTSPTNIGLYLLSVLAARDFGYITLSDFVDRIDQTLGTLERLGRYRGHFYNWYDTANGQPLQPAYISTVDSGNLVASLLVLATGCREAVGMPLVGLQLLDALEDSLELLHESIEANKQTNSIPAIATLAAAVAEARAAPPCCLAAWRSLLNRLVPLLEEAAPGVLRIPHPDTPSRAGRWAAGMDDAPYWSGRISLLASMTTREMDQLAPGEQHQCAGCNGEARIPSLSELAESVAEARTLTARLESLAARAAAMAADTDFRMLYDTQRHLFAIGLNVTTGHLDGSYYDLLASEARLASLVAIALGQIPQSHWFRLGRQLAPAPNGGRALLSWSGTMFEYLMPLLVARSYEQTLLDETCRAVVARQVEYARRRGVPWGISESAYNTMDLALNYQYRAFGVPGLGLKPGLADDLVVSPYSTALALQVDTQGATRNLRALLREGLGGQFGFYEAVDYTRGRVPPGRRAVVVRAFMAHHQGMTLVALANVLGDGAMVRRFHGDARVRATELLLQERVPGSVELTQVATDGTEASQLAPAAELGATERTGHLDGPVPSTMLLSNGSYTVLVTAGGAGRSTYRELAVTRWREDATLDIGGIACYLQDLATGTTWSATYQPTRAKPDEYHVAYTPEAARFRRRDGDIEAVTEVTVSPEAHAEVRRVTLTNLGSKPASVQLTSYAEISLAPHDADLAHPAFGNLFVETEFVPQPGALLCSRRPRSGQEGRVWLAHVAAVDSAADHPAGEFETSRERFIGRGRDLASPAAMVPGVRLSNTVGAVLDPVLSLRRVVTLRPGERAVVSLCLAAAESREAALDLADRFSDPRAATRTFELAWTDARVELRHLNLSTHQVHRFQELAGSLLFNDRERRAPADVLAANDRGQSGLWGHGISGDRPILVVRVDDPSATELVAELLLAHEYWRLNTLSVDLVLLNEDAGGYLEPLQEALLGLVSRGPAQSHLHQPGGVFVVRASQLSEPDRRLLLAVARVVLSTSRGRLARQLGSAPRTSDSEAIVTAAPPLSRATDGLGPQLDRLELQFANSRGGFTPDGRQYVIDLPSGETTPAPWSNVVANSDFGFLVTESGSGFTWNGNSQTNRLTPWSNDPVSDPAGEAIYLRDNDSGRIWSPTPLPSPSGAAYRVRHGQGASWFEHTAFGVESNMAVFVLPDDPVKVRRLRLRNLTDRTRRLSATVYAEWVLGANRDRAAAHVYTEWDAANAALLARNRYVDQAGRVAFLTASESVASFTADRAEFLGRNGSRALPAGLQPGRDLSGVTGAGFDPCGALQVAMEIGPGEVRDLVFLLGQSRTVEDAYALIGAYRSPAAAERALDATLARWEELVGALQVRTPDPALDVLVNRWLPYQVLSCRVWARSAFFQSGGAYGFRDQLQDVLMLLFAAPRLAREHILRAAARQFREGDVQHWWHPDTGQGVRTRCSDDLLWLPYVTAAYIAATGDRSILGEDIAFLEAPVLAADQAEWFGVPTVSTERASVYQHCVRALEQGMTSGAHGLPLIGDGDWNDGMNRVGHQGRGESVWLAWFLAATLETFAPICLELGDAERAQRYRAEARRLGEAADEHAWDGAWYRRAYFDDGTPLGSADNDECAIDAIAQSWAVIAGVGDPARARLAMRSLEEKLVRGDAGGLILLLNPPFDATEHDPGYIKGYVPGIRENGGQYTHAAAWAVLATALLGERGRAMELFALLNPVNHTRTTEDVARYRAEPYVVAADVYAAQQHLGRGGWTWYTGSAGWMYRVAVEGLLGFRLNGNQLIIDPRIPEDWPGFEICYRHAETTYVIHVDNPEGAGGGVRRITLDGSDLPDSAVPLVDDARDHYVRVVLA